MEADPTRSGRAGAARVPLSPRLADAAVDAPGITRRAVLSVLEAFFRHPWLHSLPLAVMLAVGVTAALDHDDRYRSVATMTATDRSLLSDVTATNDPAL